MKKIPLLLLLLSSAISTYAASSMVGACSAREAKVWIKTDALPSAKTEAYCEKTDSPNIKIKGRLESVSEDENTAVVIFPKLSANTAYKYTISDGKNQLSGTFKTRPDYEDRTPPPDFSFAVLGRNHINQREFDAPFMIPGGEYEIYDAVRKSAPNFALWVGGANDLRNADVDSRSGIFARYADARELNEAKSLLTSIPNYGVAAISNFGGADASKSNARDARDAFAAFWPNPQGPSKNFDAYSFKYSDAEFFVLDDVSLRSNLDYTASRPYFLGKEQMQWLMTALENSTAKFKFIVMNSPIANPVEKRDNFTFAAAERKELLDFLASKKISGVIFLAGNKDYGDMTRFVRAGAYPLYEMSAPPLTARPTDEIKDMNYFRIPSSGVEKRAFGIVKIDGKEDARVVTFNFINSKGEILFSSSVKEEELKKFD